MKLQGKVAMITGAGGVIGTATTLRFASEGAMIVAVDIDQTKIDVLKGKIADSTTFIGCIADVTKTAEVRLAVQKAADIGGIDILVNIAGGPSGSGHGDHPFHDKPEEIWSRVVDLNLKGAMICSHEVIARMIEKRGGKIISISSIDGLRGSADLGKCDYSAAKAGLLGFSKAIAKELGRYRINVNVVSLGQIANGREKTNADPASWERYGAGSILNRFGEPEEAAGIIAYLASSEADYITGQNFILGGGCYM
jgi:NAD(P)-dependent dehydrogenase (short-subunit alcohol dehydrogenase family)